LKEQLLKVGATRLTVTLCPALPSKSSNPMLFALPIDTVVAVPNVVRAVKATWAGVKPVGGMKRSAELVVVPAGVFKEMCPDPASAGTTMVMLDEVTALGTAAGVMFTISRSFCTLVSKLEPVIATDAPGAAIWGVKEVMPGPPDELVTVKESALGAEPLGDETVIVPVVAPPGTVTTNDVVDADVMFAGVPLKVTVS
jgi:hypothetical protein